jgi:fatty-acyl-CoA synthase
MKGYWNQPEATEDALRGGWLYTGDLGRRDDDGYFYIVDRKKDMIITGGENVYPLEVETVLVRHPEIEDAAVISVPDKVWGEQVKAVVVLKPEAGLKDKDIKEWLKGKIAPFKIPKQVTFVDSIPRSQTGKMMKRELRKSLNDR